LRIWREISSSSEPVQFPIVPKPEGLLTAIIVSGGKQYRVAPGDRILVDRLAAEPGSSLTLGRVLLLRDGTDIKVGAPTIDGVEVEAKVLSHPRGPRIETLRYKSKKRVRVHRGGRADLTALEILTVGGLTVATGTEVEVEAPAKGKPKAKPDSGRKAKPAKASAEPEVEAEVVTAADDVRVEANEEAPKKRAPRKPRAAKESD
jgi:large subunit ribosomal protein L21